MNNNNEGKEKEKVLIVLSKKDCGYLIDDVEAQIQDTEEKLAELVDPFLCHLYRINLRYMKRILFSLKKSLEEER